MPITYDVTALQLTIYYNREGDHDHNGLMFALTENVPILKYLRALAGRDTPSDSWEQHHHAAQQRATAIGVAIPARPDPLNPTDVARARHEARQPHPLVRPLVLRGHHRDTVHIHLTNEIEGRWVGPHLVGGGYNVRNHDGSDVGANPHSLTPPPGSPTRPGNTRTYTWSCPHQGVFPFHDGGNYSGGEDGTNVHGLFGALVVQPPGVTWRDPVSGRTSADGPLDGLYLDVIPPSCTADTTRLRTHQWPPPRDRFDFSVEAHREFVIFFHDEPEFMPPHAEIPPDPCGDDGGGHGGGGGGHGGGHDLLPIMPVSYRAEPMVNREHRLFELIDRGHDFKGRPVLNEEQHHSSWMFGDPVTPILRAYIGDPVRIRFVHAGVKETHVFHLHLYEWHAVPEDPSSPRIDAISIGPQTGHTIEPLWGAGNRQQVAGDVIWHCHLYPHFHEGMWGMFRTFETSQNGPTRQQLQSTNPVYHGRRIGYYPDGTPIEPLLPLPDRPLPPQPTPTHPGYPLYIPGEMWQKSPIPPWPDRNLAAGEAPVCGFRSLRSADMPVEFDYRPVPTALERKAFNPRPLPGELFTRNPFRAQQDAVWRADPKFQELNGVREVCHEVVVKKQRIDYNGYGWHDRDGHLYYLRQEGDPATRRNADGTPATKEPLFFRALHGQILNLTLDNQTPRRIAKTEFDPPFPPCPRRPWQGECALHVHMVKFDPVCGDGASVGWNYMTGPVVGKKMVYRWWLDEEFGTIFFHDHLFANYRQKHGLFGALIVEPRGATFVHNVTGTPIVSGLQALVRVPEAVDGRTWFREFCIGIGDFVPMWNRDDEPLNPPAEPGGHGDQAVMGLNYRSEPIPERLRHGGSFVDPSRWFSSLEPYWRDPYTTRFLTFEGDPVWFRVLQGSHEEQHSFQVHGMRWKRFRGNPDSALRNQQTFGIAEAFTFRNHEPYLPGDYLYKLSGADDLWLGCWGLIRTFARGAAAGPCYEPLPVAANPEGSTTIPKPVPAQTRRFHVVVEARRITYREPDLVDPFGLVYRLVSHTPPGGTRQQVAPVEPPEPLVLRCREGEWVEVTLENRLPPKYRLRPEPFAPQVPVEERHPFSHRPERPVSREASMHADLLVYDVRKSDGANVGRNPLQSVPPQKRITYTWYAYRPPNANANQPLGPVLLQDMADFRNHRHHGLVGALVVEDPNATPYRVERDAATAASGAPEAWYGARATLQTPTGRIEEAVLLLQDGLRFFLRGDVHSPVADEPPGHGEEDVDPEDQGQKGFNYRSEPVGPLTDPRYDPDAGVAPGNWPAEKPLGDWLSNPAPATPVFRVPAGRKVHLHLVGACDKPRNHSFTVHGVTWPEWRFLPAGRRPEVAAESAITAGTVRTFEFTPRHPGDHAYRSGVLKWAVPQGLWGILRVEAVAASADPAAAELAVEVELEEHDRGAPAGPTS